MNSLPLPPRGGSHFVNPSLIPVSLRDSSGAALSIQMNRRPFELNNVDGILEDWSELYLKELMIELPDTAHVAPQLWPPFSTIFLEIEGDSGAHFTRSIQYAPQGTGASATRGFPIIVNVVNQERPGSDPLVFPRLHKDFHSPGQHLIGQNGLRAHRSLPSQLFLTIRTDTGAFLLATEVVLLFNAEVGKDVTGVLQGTLPQAMQRKQQLGI